jgi:hypothetical protein
MTEMPPRQASGPLKHHYRDPSRSALPSLLRKEITWLFQKRHPKWEIRWHVLIAEWKWSLSVSNQFCSAGNSRISRSHVRSAVLRKNSRSNAVNDPKPACLRIAVPRLVKLPLSRFQSSRMQRQRGGRVATRRSRAAGNGAHDRVPQCQSIIEPDMKISRIRLSDKTSRLHPRHVVPSGPDWGQCILVCAGYLG